jgi:hypothetical protein
MITPGSLWWQRIAGQLIDEVGIERVSRSLLCVEHLPYHSCLYRPSHTLIPPQEYGFALVRAAMARQAEIVIMRLRERWFTAVPCFATHHRLHVVQNPPIHACLTEISDPISFRYLQSFALSPA